MVATDIQIETLHFIDRFCKENGYSPSIRDIGKEFGISERAVQDRVNALKKKGCIDWTPKIARSIHVIKEI